MPEEQTTQTQASDGAGQTAMAEAPKPLTEADVERLVRERMTAKLAERDKEWQSRKDREVALHKRKADALSRQVEALKATADYGTDVAPILKQAEDEAELGAYRQQEAQAKIQERALEADRRFRSDLAETIRLMGIDPAHAEIAAAAKAATSREDLRAKVMTAVKSIQEKQSMSDVRKMVKDELSNLRRELGLDSPDTSSGAKVNDSDKDFMRKFGAGDIPMSKMNMARYQKIMSADGA